VVELCYFCVRSSVLGALWGGLVFEFRVGCFGCGVGCGVFCWLGLWDLVV